MKHLRRLGRLANTARRRLKARVKWIGERLASEPGYAESLAGLAITALIPVPDAFNIFVIEGRRLP